MEYVVVLSTTEAQVRQQTALIAGMKLAIIVIMQLEEQGTLRSIKVELTG